MIEDKKPKQIFNGGKVTEGVIAQIATAKYADHLPLYIQEYIYSRKGIAFTAPSCSNNHCVLMHSFPIAGGKGK